MRRNKILDSAGSGFEHGYYFGGQARQRNNHILAWLLCIDYLESTAFLKRQDNPQWRAFLEDTTSETPEQFAARLRAEFEADPDKFLSYYDHALADVLGGMLFDYLETDPRIASAMKRAMASAHRAEEAERLRAAGKSWAAIGRDLAYAEKRPEPYSADAVRGWVRRKRGRL